MSILDIDNKISDDNSLLIWEWLKDNIDSDQYNDLINRNLIEVKNGIINAKTDIYLTSFLKAGNFPDYIKFGSINGNFVCADRNMTNLKGTPQTVLGCFDCRYNLIEDYKDGPKRVYGEYYRDYKVRVDEL